MSATGILFSVIRDGYKIPFCDVHSLMRRLASTYGEYMQTIIQLCGRLGELVFDVIFEYLT